jgi:hypothetical protein
MVVAVVSRESWDGRGCWVVGVGESRGQGGQRGWARHRSGPQSPSMAKRSNPSFEILYPFTIAGAVAMLPDILLSTQAIISTPPMPP